VGTLIDTSVLIAAERGQLDPERVSDEPDAEEIAIAAITASELLHGLHRLKPSLKRARAERFVEAVLGAFPVIAFDLSVARIHAQLEAHLAASGASIGAADLQIAATAVWLDYRIATRDLRSFLKIRGLHVVKW
jgi:tRNA(fMet)-specific endonuclease VapC